MSAMQNEIEEILNRVASGELSPADAQRQLQSFVSGEYDTEFFVDFNRHQRCLFPEVIYGAGKNLDQLDQIIACFFEREHPIFVTRIQPDIAEQLLQRYPRLQYHPLARTLRWGGMEPYGHMDVAVLCAGTSDLNVAYETTETLTFLGIKHRLICDVGVAGIHRLFKRKDEFLPAQVIIVIAGMEGALPSVVAGLVSQPVIAVPTSVGYGTSLHGFTPLMAMLTSCASGVTVVNIDNGFGAACAAHRIISQLAVAKNDSSGRSPCPGE